MPGAYGRGGGLSRCHGIIQNNRISQNSAMMGGGLSDCAGVIRNNTIAHNLVGYLGGGLHNCSGIIQNNTILCNSTVGHGGGLAYCAGTIRNNVIVCNLAPYGAGGALHHCGGHIENNTIFGNSAGNGGGGLDDCDATVVNCIIWQNSPDQLREVLTVRYSDVQGGWPAEGNIDVDPCFADVGYWDPNGTPEDANDDFWVNGDYHLKSQAGRWDAKSQSWVKDDVTSPCIDAGDPNNPIGNEPFPNGGIINMGAYGGTVEASKSYFGSPVCNITIPGDINGDCKVDILDLTLMGLHWLEDNTPVNSNCIVKDGVEYYMQADKSVYHLGENVAMLYRVTNLSDKVVRFCFRDQVQYYFEVTQNGDLIWLMPKVGLAAFSSFVLGSNDSNEYTENWSMVNENGTPWLLDDDFPADAGTYDIVGSLHPILLAQEDRDKYVPISVSIDVIR
jgi:hypothetical protein